MNEQSFIEKLFIIIYKFHLFWAWETQKNSNCSLKIDEKHYCLNKYTINEYRWNSMNIFLYVRQIELSVTHW